MDVVLHYRGNYYSFGVVWGSPLIISLFSAYSVLLMVLVIIRRNHFPLKARSLFNMLALLIVQPIAQAVLLFPYAIPCALYHFGVATLVSISFVFIATRLLHFFFLYTFYNRKTQLFNGENALKHMRLFKLLTSGILHSFTLGIVVIFGCILVVIVSAATRANIWRSSEPCTILLPCKF
jgi:hypothetical protein